MSRVDARRARPVPHRVHLVGVGGVGMSSVARLLALRGHDVSGSDLKDSGAVEELRRLGMRIRVGHDPAAVEGAELVVVSTAVPATNPELVAALDARIPVVVRARALADLMADETAVLVAGTHGKTTTTGMIAVALHATGLDPSFAIGGQLNEVGSNAHAGADPVFVAEADESDRSFLAYEPDLAVVTNVELDHPDEFLDDAAVDAAFAQFLDRRAHGAPVLLGADDPGAARLAATAAGPVLRYGEAPDADVRLVVTGPRQGRVELGGATVDVELRVPGRHNLHNATAALAVVDQLGRDVVAAAARLGHFEGAVRRFQRLGQVRGVSVVDDYAHHPTELRTTLAAARAETSGRVVVVVQPHRFSRTERLGSELGRAAAAADLVVVTEVYAANEEPVPGVSGELVATAVEAAGGTVLYEPHLGRIAADLAPRLREGDMVLVTGAGDVTQVGPALLRELGGVRG